MIENGSVVKVRRSTLEWILFGALGFLALVVSGYVGRTLNAHEIRIDALESRVTSAQTTCEATLAALTSIDSRLQNIERALIGREPTNGGGN